MRMTPDAIMVTPEMAKSWLQHNGGNRSLRPTHVKDLAAKMQAGRWRLTHQGIAISATGRLLDGQHRLEAVVQSGCTVPMMVFTGCDEEMFGVLDKGIIRTIRDDLKETGRVVDPCSLLARLAQGVSLSGTRVDSCDVDLVIDILRPSIDAMLATASSNARGRTASGIRAGWILRHATSPLRQDYLCEQWRAWVHLDTAAMAPGTSALLRRIESVSKGGTRSSVQAEHIAISWIAFDPSRRAFTKIVIKDIDGILDEVRERYLSVAASFASQIANRKAA
ncbi:conserved protein of unknown function (plasmid) [Rhodovastum atsumiense]|uniref:ParB/Sulfiredoxin domain-containing protein n=1 Tax=Rhodovastum atsumiense TaxID=504468 RepID=A0A5M6IN51_9PROT|nr:hypothetical protein [Rhodovastum atsumiense]KAA5609691.1 hypothetical protein F1189_23310 [Rhodovastum atsumiense]CAH2606469.1 conserved protein of unknown function [Rhodovastum atsumiense]